MEEEKIKITLDNKNELFVNKGTKALTLFEKYYPEYKNIYAAKVNNKIYPIEKELKYNSILEPVFNTSREGASIYRRSLCFLLATASKKLFPDARLLVGHSLEHGYYYTLESGKPVSISDVQTLEEEMKELVEQNLKIESSFISYQQAVELFERIGLKETRHQLDFICAPKVRINTLENFSDIYFGPLVPATSVLKVFELRPYNKGFLLRFPKVSQPNVLTPFNDQPKLFEVYSKYKDWGKRLKVTSVANLNQLIIDRKINDFIDITETLQEKCISNVANQIAEKKSARVVLIAGPSSSGKTTTSKKLALELQAIGYTPKVISIDSYYLPHTKTPKDENGNLDFECLEALDIELLNKNLVDLFDGKEVTIPSYSFHEGIQYFEEKNKMALAENEILIMEGIHGLNNKLTPKIPEEMKFKIYLSALTQLNLDDHNRISTSDNRLIRRIVRDYNFRGKSAAGTIAMWPSVRRGEEQHIFPFQNNADAVLNTALDYELSVLKVYAEPLLRCVKPSEKEYTEACQLLKFLDNFATIAPTQVPSRSIIREFIGGSAFKY